jgi:hypothetical protein
MSLPARKNLELPMMMFVTTCEEDNGCVAHALDFDIVAVAPSPEEAMEKVRFAVKSYIEYGLNNNLEADILYRAPQHFWDRISPDTPIKMMEPITVNDRRLLVVTTAHHGTNATARVA